MDYAWIDSPIGRLLAGADEGGLRYLDFPSAKPRPLASWQENPDALGEVRRQLEQYFAGQRNDFDLKLAPQGTAFQQTVWKELLNIPYGTTISYGELAWRIGNPKAPRAVGLANGSNPIPIIIPCHRVIGSNRKLTGYGGGLPIKEFLLKLERSHVDHVDGQTSFFETPGSRSQAHR